MRGSLIHDAPPLDNERVPYFEVFFMRACGAQSGVGVVVEREDALCVGIGGVKSTHNNVCYFFFQPCLAAPRRAVPSQAAPRPVYSSINLTVLNSVSISTPGCISMPALNSSS